MSVIEGLICPECMKNFTTLKALQDHFQQFHVEQSAIFLDNGSNGFFGVLKKAKKTFEEIFDTNDSELHIVNTLNTNILKSQEKNSPDFDSDLSYAFYEEPNIRPQPDGIVVNRTEEFLKMRQHKLLHSAIEMSSLIIKIEKLTSFQSNGNFRDRRCFEQSVVDWVSDDLVPMCPTCGSKFGLHLPLNTSKENPVLLCSSSNEIKVKKQSKLKTGLMNLMDLEIDNAGLLIRKKHHCRLCGCVLCAQCSYMLPLPQANRLVTAVNSRFEFRASLLEESQGLLWKDDSQSSIDSIKNKIRSKEYSIRCCGNCKSLIEAKWNQIDKKVTDNEIIELYQKLYEKMERASQLLPQYDKMCGSLCSGETEYSYQRASELRSEFVVICQQIDSIGKQFKNQISNEAIGPGSEAGVGITGKKANLVKAVYHNSLLFLQKNFATLKQLPPEEEVEELARNRLLRIRKKAEEETANQKATLQSSQSESTSVPSLNPSSGWAPDLIKTSHKTNGHKTSSNPFDCYQDDDVDIEDHPMDEMQNRLKTLALQMENVRQYIEMAQKAKKSEEVKILKKNMMDLEFEYEALHKRLKM